MHRSLLVVALLSPVILLVSCSEEEYGSLYCPEGPRDTLVVYPRLNYQQVKLIDDASGSPDGETGMAAMQSLYLGGTAETRSEILANYDFSQVVGGDHPASVFESEHIRDVQLHLHRLRGDWFVEETVDGYPVPAGIVYDVRQLTGPFDPRDYHDWPGPAPDMHDEILNMRSSEPVYSDQPILRLAGSTLIDWVRTGGMVGLAIEAATESDSGLVGFASRELTNYGQIDAMVVGTEFEPTLVVRFLDDVAPDLFITPTHDTSTFRQIADPPADLVLVQTGMHSFPVLSFDMPRLPAGSCAPEIYFRFFPQDLDPLMQWNCLVLAHLDSTVGDWPSGVVTGSGLEAAATFLSRFCPGREGKSGLLEFGPFGDKAEPATLPEVVHMMFRYDDWTGIPADIYFSQSTFHGPAAALADRPAMFIVTGRRGD